MILETERLILRPFDESDAESVYEYAKEPEVGPAAGWPVHTSVENSREIIKTVLAVPETYAVCLKPGGAAVGAVGLMVGNSNPELKENEGEIGYWLGKPYWGRGIIPEAVRELIRHSFEELNIETLWCGYFEGNEKSKRAQEKCGFVYHHTNRDIHWQLTDDIRTEHITRLTKEDYFSGSQCGKKFNPAEETTVNNMQNKALVVIDLQNDITKHYKDIIENVNAAIEWAQSDGMQVIYIKHNNITAGTRTFRPDSRGSELVPELRVVSGNIFVKTKSSALTSEPFSGFIRENGIDEFFITGADATACIKSTCFNMAKAGFKVHVFSDCVTSYDLKKLPEMFAYYESKGCKVRPFNGSKAV